MQSETSVHMMNYHFVWNPKYRRKVIIGNVEEAGYSKKNVRN
jgi:REP element-mobilizing transposase RayT